MPNVRSGFSGRPDPRWARLSATRGNVTPIRVMLVGGALRDVGCDCVSLAARLAGTTPDRSRPPRVCLRVASTRCSGGLLGFGDGRCAGSIVGCPRTCEWVSSVAGSDGVVRARDALVPPLGAVRIEEWRGPKRSLIETSTTNPYRRRQPDSALDLRARLVGARARGDRPRRAREDRRARRCKACHRDRPRLHEPGRRASPLPAPGDLRPPPRKRTLATRADPLPNRATADGAVLKQRPLGGRPDWLYITPRGPRLVALLQPSHGVVRRFDRRVCGCQFGTESGPGSRR